jgi:hypothetical protein
VLVITDTPKMADNIMENDSFVEYSDVCESAFTISVSLAPRKIQFVVPDNEPKVAVSARKEYL